MKPSKLNPKRITQIMGAALSLLLVSITAWGQARTSLTGKYEGTAKGPNGDVVLKLDLVDESGKFSGQITSPRSVYKIAKGQMTDGVLTLEAEGNGSTGKLTLRQKDDKLAGDFSADGRTGPVEFHRVVSDDISGEWDAAADAQGQAFPPIAESGWRKSNRQQQFAIGHLGDFNGHLEGWKTFGDFRVWERTDRADRQHSGRQAGR